MLINKKYAPIVIFYSSWKTKYLFSFYHAIILFHVNNITLTFTLYFLMKIQNKRELNQTGFCHSSYIVFDDFIKIYMKCTNEPDSFSVNDTTFLSNNLLRFRSYLIERIY